MGRSRPRYKAACRLSNRNSKSENLQKPADKISHIDTVFYVSDYWSAYKFIDQTKHLTGKAHTYTVERMNRLLCHYFARFVRKTYCYLKNPQMIKCFLAVRAEGFYRMYKNLVMFFFLLVRF